MTFPCTAITLSKHVQQGEYQSYTLKNGPSIVGFGQIQLLGDRAHLARLIINPDNRGQGLAKRLISELKEQAQRQIQLKQLSLFVYVENHVAMACYETFGFRETPSPAGINKPAGCRFMTMRV